MYINQMSAPLLLIPGFLFPGRSERLPTSWLVGETTEVGREFAKMYFRGYQNEIIE
jgi:hypothetical protein